MTRVLCVAEKPAISRAIADALSGGSLRVHNTSNKYIKNYDFAYNTQVWGPCQFTVTAASGHITDMKFPPPYDDFGYDPKSLLSAPVLTGVTNDGKAIAANIGRQARFNDILYIWTDCDREGEHIGGEVCNIAKEANPRLTVYRATFNNAEHSHIREAVESPGQLDWNQVQAVDVRIELDLRSGFALTRQQTAMFRRYAGPTFARQVVSYGSCQFPTLGFVVDRALKKEHFISESYWTLTMTVSIAPPGVQPYDINFRWARSRLFSEVHVLYRFEECVDSGQDHAVITKITRSPMSKFKPLPLTTVTLQKKASKALKMSSKEIMDHAERLYNEGFVSYPRTETDHFNPAIDLKKLVRNQCNSAAPWSQQAHQIISQGIDPPRGGKNDDHAHPPIHPVQFVTQSRINDSRKWSVYEFICRSFLASCMKDARGFQTKVEAKIHTETFRTKGEQVTETNFLDVYKYIFWNSKPIPNWKVGDRIQPSSLMMDERTTNAPKLLTEADLVSLMDANGIGTDATMADHIDKIQKRDFVKKQGIYFAPTKLGSALFLGYEKLNLRDPITRPLLRHDTEIEVGKIASGTDQKAVVLSRLIKRYEVIFNAASNRQTELMTEINRVLST